MSEQAELEARVERLEERVAYQDQAIEDLSSSLNDQFKLVESLKRDLARLTEQLKAVETAIDAPAEPDPPPPHY